MSIGSVLLTGGARTGRTSALCLAALQALRHKEPPVVVAIDGNSSGELATYLQQYVGQDWGWSIDRELLPNVMHLAEQASLTPENGTFRSLLVLIDRIDLLEPEVVPILPDLVRLISSGSKRQAMIVATTDDRSRLNDDLYKAFRHRLTFRNDGSYIFSDGQGLLTRLYRAAGAIRRTPSVRRIDGRPIGILSPDEVKRRMGDRDRLVSETLRIFFDDVRQAPVDHPLDSDLAIAGGRRSGKTYALARLCEDLYANSGIPVPLLRLRSSEVSSLGEATSSIGPELAAAEPTSAEEFAKMLGDLCADARLLAIDDLDMLSAFTARLGLEWSRLKFIIQRLIRTAQLQIVATGPLEILQGAASEANGIADSLRLIHSNFIMLQPPDEETVVHSLGVFRGNAGRRFSGRPGRTYGPGYGYAYVGGIRHEGHVPVMKDDFGE